MFWIGERLGRGAFEVTLTGYAGAIYRWVRMCVSHGERPAIWLFSGATAAVPLTELRLPCQNYTQPVAQR
jgi:hypothetical protein